MPIQKFSLFEQIWYLNVFLWKELATPRFKRATVQNYKTGNASNISNDFYINIIISWKDDYLIYDQKA